MSTQNQTGTQTPPPAEEHRHADLIARIAPVLFLVFWSSGFGFSKVGLQHAPPLTFLALRYGIIVVVFLPLFFILKAQAPARAIGWLHIAVVGFLIQSVYFGLAYGGMNLGVSAGVTAVIASMQPLLVALASPFVTGERINLVKWVGLILGAAGAIIVIVGSQTGEMGAALDIGLVLCVGSTVGMAAATLYQKRFPVKAHPVTINLIQYAVGLVTIAPMALTFESGPVDWSPGLFAALGWLVVANSLISISLLLFMLGRSEASKVSALFFLIPPVAAVFGWVLLGEQLTLIAIAGMVIAGFGVWLVSRPQAA